MGPARFTGHYFNFLGATGILGMIASLILGDSLTLDFSFILYFWLGAGLLKAREGRRRIALVVSVLVVIVSACYLVAMYWTAGPVSGPRNELRTTEFAAVSAGIILILFLPPTILLLLPRTRSWFAAPQESALLSKREIAITGLAALVLVAGGAALERATRVLVPSGKTMSFHFGDNQSGFATMGWMEEKETGRPRYVSWVAFAEANSCSSPINGIVTFGKTGVAVPDDKPVRYLFTPPTPKVALGNVLFVRKDGTVTRLALHVKPEQVDALFDAAGGVRDIEELKVRTESILLHSIPEERR